MFDNSARSLNDVIANIIKRIKSLETNPRSEVTGAVQTRDRAKLLATVPNKPGRVFFSPDYLQDGVAPTKSLNLFDDGTRFIPVAQRLARYTANELKNDEGVQHTGEIVYCSDFVHNPTTGQIFGRVCYHDGLRWRRIEDNQKVP